MRGKELDWSRGAGAGRAVLWPVQSNCASAGAGSSGRSKAMSTLGARGPGRTPGPAPGGERPPPRPRRGPHAGADARALGAPGDGADAGARASGGGHGADVLAFGGIALDAAFFAVDLFAFARPGGGQAGGEGN